MLSSEECIALAKQLDHAEHTCTQIPALTDRYPDLSVESAYAIQREWVKMRIARGEFIKGHKIGITSRAMQQLSNIDEPDYGTLTDRMFYEQGTTLPLGKLITPGAEIELAFVLNKRLEGEDISIYDVLNATDYVTPAIEIIDRRCPRVGKVVNTIADNAANACVILGGRPVRPMDLDLRWVPGLLYKNGVLEETGVAAGVLNHPANGIAWLARKLSKHGVALEPGQIVLGGSFVRPVEIKSGDTFHADFGPLGGIGFGFS